MWVPQYKDEYSRKGVRGSAESPAGSSVTCWKLRYVKQVSAIVEWAPPKRSGCVQRCSWRVKWINLTVEVTLSTVTSPWQLFSKVDIVGMSSLSILFDPIRIAMA